LSAGPKVVVIGRANVGKSTLVNRLAGRRLAIAHESSGVTRDRVEVPVRWGDRSFTIVDTGGFAGRPRGIEQAVAAQAATAVEQSDLIILLVDAQTGITEEDEQLARQLRKAEAPVLVVANKVDSATQEPLAAEFHALGLGEPLAVSALHGRGSGELLDRILDLDLPADTQPQVDGEPRFCLVGRPNVGKSSLFNRLVKEDRMVVHEEPGTTRDAVDSLVEVDERLVRFVDTAGLRRPIKTQGVEYYGLVRSLRAIEASDVALLVVEAPQGFTGEDKRIAAKIAEVGRGLVGALNKWDLIPGEERADLFVDLKQQLKRVVRGAPVIRASALTGLGVGQVAPALLRVHDSWTRRVPTGEVNRVLEAATGAHPPPRQAGRIMYGTQVSAGPPSFVLFGARDPGPSYRRYLENTLRREFGLEGVPVRVSFRPRRPRSDRAGGKRSGGRSRAEAKRGGAQSRATKRSGGSGR
jgi:GTP-binding protein